MIPDEEFLENDYEPEPDEVVVYYEEVATGEDYEGD